MYITINLIMTSLIFFVEVFKYAPGTHNVVVVDKASYDACIVPGNAKTFASGNDVVTLGKGPNYFICGFPRHCGFGMKIAANAA